MISEKMKGYVANSSVIRAMFEEGKKMAAIYGADHVYDFSLVRTFRRRKLSKRQSRIFLTGRIRFWSTAI